MPEIGPEHPTTYRQEIVQPIFHRIQARGSCVVISAASMGKSRLVQFLLRADVQHHYLGEKAEHFLFVWADCNRMAQVTEWGLYELLLTGLIEACGQHPRAQELRPELVTLRQEAILTANPLLAQRHLELAVRMLCQEQGLSLAILLDEFDESYRTLPAQVLANLRGLRDVNKYRLSYVLFTREHPAQLRVLQESEGFYELFSRSVYGLKPYQKEDARRILQQLQVRRQHELGSLSQEAQEELLRLSGGHPGLLVALVDALASSSKSSEDSWETWAQNQPAVQEENRKIWHSLSHQEQLTANRLAQGISTGFREREPLELRGLIRQLNGRIEFFSPLFRQYAIQNAPTSLSFWLDHRSGAVWVNGQPIIDLTPLEYKFVEYLETKQGELCTRDELLEHLYQETSSQELPAGTDSRLDALVRRIRKKIELDPSRPRFILTVRGRGYRLAKSNSQSSSL